MAVREAELAQALAGLDALESSLDRPPSRLRRTWSSLWPKAAAIALALALWQLVVATGWREEYILPAPGTVLSSLFELLRTGDFWEAVATTMQRAAVGYVVAVALGLVVGVAVARVRVLRVAVGSMITGLQTMPSIAWFPLAIVLFKLSEGAILFVVVLGAAPSVANGVIAGVDQVPPILLRAGRILGARGLQLFRHVVIPAALPSCVAGLKQGWAFAWRSLMAGELLNVVAEKPALGVQLQYARELSQYADLMAWMIVILVIGLLVDAVFTRIDGTMRARRGLVEA